MLLVSKSGWTPQDYCIAVLRHTKALLHERQRTAARGAAAHFMVCFVSGYLGFSLGRCTRGWPKLPDCLKMDGLLSDSDSGTETPPAIIGECVTPSAKPPPIALRNSRKASGRNSLR